MVEGGEALAHEASTATVLAVAPEARDIEHVQRSMRRGEKPSVSATTNKAAIGRLLTHSGTWECGVGVQLAPIDAQADVLAREAPAMWREWIAAGDISSSAADDPHVRVVMPRWSCGARLAGDCVAAASLVLGRERLWSSSAAVRCAFSGLRGEVRADISDMHQTVMAVGRRELADGGRGR